MYKIACGVGYDNVPNLYRLEGVIEFVLLNREHGICISSSEGRKIKYKEGNLNGKCDE